MPPGEGGIFLPSNQQFKLTLLSFCMAAYVSKPLLRF